jgi:hypothetical protein
VPETSLYPAVERFLQTAGFDVKGRLSRAHISRGGIIADADSSKGWACPPLRPVREQLDK